MVEAVAPFRESVASPDQQIAIGRLNALNPGPAEATGGKPSPESRFHAGIFFDCFLYLVRLGEIAC